MGPSHTTSTRVRVPRTGVPLTTSAPTLITMVSNLRRFSQKLALQVPTGTTLHLSTHSSWPPASSGLAQFAVTVMPMPIPTLMIMVQALMHLMIVSEFRLSLWGSYRVCSFSLCFLWLHTWRACHSQLRLVIDSKNLFIGQYDKLFEEYWLSPISYLSPYRG
jgi:hypothetical protein